MGDMISDRLGVTVAIMQLPIGSEDRFSGVVDLVSERAIIWQSDKLGAEYQVIEIPNEIKEKSAKYRASLIETIVEVNDEIMEKYLSGKTLQVEEIMRCIRQGVINGSFFPVL